MSIKQVLTMTNNRTPVVGYIPDLIGSGRLDTFLDEEVCRRKLLSIYFPSGPQCPRCGFSDLNSTAIARFWSGSRFNCRGCLQKVSPTCGTVLSSKISAAQIITIAALLFFDINPSDVAKATGVKAETVRAWSDKFKGIAEIGQL